MPLAFELRTALLDAREASAVAEDTTRHQTLAEVVRWGLDQRPARLVRKIVRQDEFTQDVVIPYDERLYLVYDTS